MDVVVDVVVDVVTKNNFGSLHVKSYSDINANPSLFILQNLKRPLAVVAPQTS
jgi:hypothetical protein